MTAAIPPYGAARPVRIEFRRGSLKALLIGLPLTGFLAAVSIMGAIWPEKYLTNGADNSTGGWIAGGCGVLFGGIFLLLLVSIPAMMRQRGVDLDTSGITWWDGKARMLFRGRVSPRSASAT